MQALVQSAETFCLEPAQTGAVRSLWEGWKRLGKKIGDLQARALLTVFYFVFFGPFALAVRWWSDPLGIKLQAFQGWRPRAREEKTPLDRANRQF